jgi:hypothetical protein
MSTIICRCRVNYNGHPIQTMTQLLRLVGDTPPGTEVTITVRRQGEEMKFRGKVTELSERYRAEATKNLSLNFWEKFLPEGWIKSGRPHKPQLEM